MKRALIAVVAATLFVVPLIGSAQEHQHERDHNRDHERHRYPQPTPYQAIVIVPPEVVERALAAPRPHMLRADRHRHSYTTTTTYAVKPAPHVSAFVDPETFGSVHTESTERTPR